MTDRAPELRRRLGLVRRALALSTEPLDLPLGLVFQPLDGEQHVESWRTHAARVAAGQAFSGATLYVHIPFCARVCTYCLLSASKHPGKSAVDAYVGALRTQARFFADIAEPLRFDSLHVGGGTPTILSEHQLDALFTDLRRFRLSDGAQIGVEAHPATSTPARLEVLRRHGVHRLSFGVESLTGDVLARVNRQDQTIARVQAAVQAARRLGFSINIDLLAGLPGETDRSWRETVERTLDLEPDSLSVNRFLGENSALAAFGYGPNENENRRADAMLFDADAIVRRRAPPRWPEHPLARASFGTQYVWDRSSDARRYFQDDMIGPVSTLALGHGALGHLHARGFTIPAGAIGDYVSSIEQGRAPGMLQAPVDERFEMAFFAMEQACRGRLGRQEFERMFGTSLDAAFGGEIEFLIREGLLVARGSEIAKPDDPEFQSAHLLAFLIRDAEDLAEPVAALADAGEVYSRSASSGWLRLRTHDDVEELVRRYDGGDRELLVDVGTGLDGETATALASAASRGGWKIHVQGDRTLPLKEYAHLRELPPSMLWVRIAVRASQSARGEQRIALSGRRGVGRSNPDGTEHG